MRGNIVRDNSIVINAKNTSEELKNSNIKNNVVGKIVADINTYKGKETTTAITKVDNYNKTIEVDIKDEILDNKQNKLVAGNGISLDDEGNISVDDTIARKSDLPSDINLVKQFNNIGFVTSNGNTIDVIYLEDVHIKEQ